jgi:ribonuclease HII
MTERVRELLEFDLALIDAIEIGRPIADVVAADDLAELRGARPELQLFGFDEAGRGALAGPVAVGCVRIDLRQAVATPLDREALVHRLAELDDSKRLTPQRREALFKAITSAFDWGLGCASATEVDRYGIVEACRRAACRAFAKLPITPDLGVFDRGLSADAGFPEIQFTRGDSLSLHVAAASIIAKVGRDAIMKRLDQRFPGYGIARHKGYGTAAHRDAVGRLGPSIIHRRSFLGSLKNAESQSC